MFETLLVFIKECQRKIGAGVRVGISMDEYRIILVAHGALGDWSYRYQFTVTEVLDIASDEFPFDFFAKTVKKKYEEYLLKGEINEH